MWRRRGCGWVVVDDAAELGVREIRARTLGLLERTQDRLEDMLAHSNDVGQVVAGLRALAQVTRELRDDEVGVDEEARELVGECRRMVEEVWRGCPRCAVLEGELAAARAKLTPKPKPTPTPRSRSRKPAG